MSSTIGTQAAPARGTRKKPTKVAAATEATSHRGESPPCAPEATGAAPLVLVGVPVGGVQLQAAQEAQNIWVPVPATCKIIGVKVYDQLVKMRDKGWATTRKIRVVAADGKVRSTWCIEHRSLPSWLMSIGLNKVKPEVREPLTRIHLEGKDALADHFFGTRISASERAELRAMRADFAAMKEQLAGLVDCSDRHERRLTTVEAAIARGTLGSDGATKTTVRLDAVAALWLEARLAETIEAARGLVEQEVRGLIPFGGMISTWEMMPREYAASLERALLAVERQGKRALALVKPTAKPAPKRREGWSVTVAGTGPLPGQMALFVGLPTNNDTKGAAS